MKSTLRSKLTAAALLLVPVGALLAAGPAAAEHRDGPHDRGYGWDQRAPRIFDVTPDDGDRVGERGWTRISARYRDHGTGVATVSLRVDGRDVTGRARVESDEIRYAENLRPGRHWAEVVVRDHAGNASRRSWVFDVVERRGDGYGAWGQQPQRW